MTEAQLLVCLAVLVTGLGSAALARPLLRWLPEPPVANPPGYAELATPGFVLAVGLISAVAAAVAWTALPSAVQPLWTVLAVGGVLLAAIDQLTTWLPLRLVQVTWAAMVVATSTGAALGGGWPMLLRAAAGAAIAGALYFVFWWASRGGFGFGDVRFAPLLGSATAAVDWRLLALALLAGSLVGALLGVVRLLVRRRGSFAYAPSMLLGAYLAALTLWR